jgi:hypothetical protein
MLQKGLGAVMTEKGSTEVPSDPKVSSLAGEELNLRYVLVSKPDGTTEDIRLVVSKPDGTTEDIPLGNSCIHIQSPGTNNVWRNHHVLISEMKDKRTAGVFGMSTTFRLSGDTARQHGIRLTTLAGHEGSQNNGPDCLPDLV